MNQALYKMAAHTEITGLKSEKNKVKAIEAVSIKYQVLVEETAMVGVIEQSDPVTGELKKYELDASKENEKKGKGEVGEVKVGAPPPDVAKAFASAQSRSVATTRGSGNDPSAALEPIY